MPSWISDFKTYASAWFVNDLWSEWGGLWALGVAAGKHVFYEHTRRHYPNFYLLMVGPPGTGKSEVIEAVRSVMVPLGRWQFAPNSSTRAAMLDYMQDNLVSTTVGGKPYISNECIALNEELGSLIPENDTWYLTTMNELYDCRSRYVSRTRSGGNLELQEPYAALLSGAQPQFLALTFPEQAWGMGFMSRTVMVYGSTIAKRKDLFAIREEDRTLRDSLATRLRDITELNGKFFWKQDTRARLQAWYDADLPPKPEHPRLENYCARRILIVYKLCMAYALSDGTLEISTDHLDQARDLLLETEALMPNVFLEMGGNLMHSAMLDIAQIVKGYFIKFQKPLPESKLIQLLAARLAPNQIVAALQTMITTQLIVSDSNPPGMRNFMPGTAGGSHD